MMPGAIEHKRIEKARSHDVRLLWTRLGLPALPERGNVPAPWRQDDTPSVQVGGRKNLVTDYGTNETMDAIALVRKLRRCGFKEAIDFILNSKATSTASPPTTGHKGIKPAGRLQATYDYRDPSGALQFQVLRYADPKDFRQRRPDGHGGWIHNMQGVKRILYRLPELAQAVARGQLVVIPEGEKDVDRLHTLGLAATTNSGGAGKWRGYDYEEPLRGARVCVLPDNDAAGEQHGLEVASSLAGIATEVKILRLPVPLKGDASVWLDAGHTAEELLALADAAPAWTAETQSPTGKPGTLPGEKIKDHPTVAIGPDEGRVVDEALVALARDPELYQRSLVLVTVVEDAQAHGGIERQGSPIIAPLPVGNLRERLVRQARIVRRVQTRHGEVEEPGHPPLWLIQELHQRLSWPGIRPLRAVVPYPVLLPNGTILTRPGYDSSSGLLLVSGLKLQVPAQPTAAEVQAAVDLLMDLVVDFPFEAPEHRAAWLAGLLTPLARHAFEGPAPMFVVDKNVRGCGGSLLCDAVALLLTGRPMARMVETEDQGELRKRVTAILLSGDPLALLDNLTLPLGGGVLDALLTSSSWRDRMLGRSEMTTELPAITTWFSSGNNVQLDTDMVRRICHVRLCSLEENPEARTGFRHPDLRSFILGRREQLLTAALTILRGHAAAGRPDQRLPTWGSFEAWSAVVRGALVWAGLPDPGQTRRELLAVADREGAGLALLLRGLLEMFPGARRITVADVMRRLNAPGFEKSWPTLRAAVDELALDRAGRPNGKILAAKLRHFRGRVADGLRLELEAESRREGNFWQVVRVASVAPVANSPIDKKTANSELETAGCAATAATFATPGPQEAVQEELTTWR